MQAHFNETLASLNGWSVAPVFIAFGVLVSMLGFMFMSSFALASGGQSVKSFMKSVLVLSLSFIVFIGASVMFYIEKSKIEDARTERTAVIIDLVEAEFNSDGELVLSPLAT